MLHVYLLLLLVILYSQVLSGILVSGDGVILFVYILREVKCKFIIIYIYIKKLGNEATTENNGDTEEPIEVDFLEEFQSHRRGQDIFQTGKNKKNKKTQKNS